MSNAPKWIADVLEKLPGAVGPREREALAVEIAEAFPVLECTRAATESLIAQFKRNGIGISDTEARAIAGNMLTAISGAVMEPNTEATEYVREFVEMSGYLGNLGAPWAVDGRHLRIAERLELLINRRREGDTTLAGKLERLRAAHRAFWAAYQDGEISDVHHDDETENHHTPEAYDAPHLAGYCRHCTMLLMSCDGSISHECPEDDTCECAGRAALNELQHAIDDVAGKIGP